MWITFNVECITFNVDCVFYSIGMLNSLLAKKLSDIYHYSKSPASFGGEYRLYRAAREANLKVTRKQIKEYLATLPDYGLHKPQSHNFPRRKIISFGIDWLWEVDLAEMKKAKLNKGFKYLLIKIDVFSKLVHVIPLKRKNKEVMLEAFKKLFAEAGTTPKNLYSDRGTEFTNDLVQALFAERKINHYFAYDDRTGAPTAERVIRTLKGRLYRYMTLHRSGRYIDKLANIVYAYNHAVHRSIKMAPADVTPDLVPLIRARLYPEDEIPKNPPRFKIGDKVRRQRYFHNLGMHKGYTNNQYTGALYRVASIKKTIPYTYKLVADNDNWAPPVMGSFYENQLQLSLPAIELPKAQSFLEEESPEDADIPEYIARKRKIADPGLEDELPEELEPYIQLQKRTKKTRW